MIDIKKQLIYLGNIKDAEDFENESRIFIQNLRNTFSHEQLINELKKIKLNKTEISILEQACYISENTALKISIKKAIANNYEHDIESTMEWFQTEDCYKEIYRQRQTNFSEEYRDFFENFQKNVLPNIKSEHYAILFTYIKSGNFKHDIESGIFKSINNDELHNTLLERAQSLIIPIRMIKEGRETVDLIIEDDHQESLNKNGVAKSGFIDIAMREPNSNNIFISNVTANTIYKDTFEHLKDRANINQLLRNIEKHSGINFIKLDFYKCLLQNTIQNNLTNNNKEVTEQLFILINSLPNNIYNHIYQDNHTLQFFGTEKNGKINETGDIYSDFMVFVDLINKHYNHFTPKLRGDIQNALKVSAEWLAEALDMETDPNNISRIDLIINIDKIEKLQETIQVREIDRLKLKLRKERRLTPEDRAFDNQAEIIDKNKRRTSQQNNKQSKIQFLSQFEKDIAKTIEIYAQRLFDIIYNANQTHIEYSDRKLFSDTKYQQLMRGKMPDYRTKPEKEFYETFLFFQSLGFYNSIGYTNKDIPEHQNQVIQLFDIVDSIETKTFRFYNLNSSEVNQRTKFEYEMIGHSIFEYYQHPDYENIENIAQTNSEGNEFCIRKVINKGIPDNCFDFYLDERIKRKEISPDDFIKTFKAKLFSDGRDFLFLSSPRVQCAIEDFKNGFEIGTTFKKFSKSITKQEPKNTPKTKP